MQICIMGSGVYPPMQWDIDIEVILHNSATPACGQFQCSQFRKYTQIEIKHISSMLFNKKELDFSVYFQN